MYRRSPSHKGFRRVATVDHRPQTIPLMAAADPNPTSLKVTKAAYRQMIVQLRTDLPEAAAALRKHHKTTKQWTPTDWMPIRHEHTTHASESSDKVFITTMRLPEKALHRPTSATAQQPKSSTVDSTVLARAKAKFYSTVSDVGTGEDDNGGDAGGAPTDLLRRFSESIHNDPEVKRVLERPDVREQLAQCQNPYQMMAFLMKPVANGEPSLFEVMGTKISGKMESGELGELGPLLSSAESFMSMLPGFGNGGGGRRRGSSSKRGGGAKSGAVRRKRK